MNIIFDWDGTIAKPDVAKEAASRRLKSLGQTVDDGYLSKALKNNDHYKLNKELISGYTGIKSDKELTIMMTDMFKFHYTAVVHELGDKALYDGMREVIQKLATGNNLVIASTLRRDILDYSLMNLDMQKYFKKIYANTPDLKYSKEDLVRLVKRHMKRTDYMIGDKEEDILAGKAVNAKTIYVTWGATGNDFVGIADNSAVIPEDILRIIK